MDQCTRPGATKFTLVGSDTELVRSSRLVVSSDLVCEMYAPLFPSRHRNIRKTPTRGDFFARIYGIKMTRAREVGIIGGVFFVFATDNILLSHLALI